MIYYIIIIAALALDQITKTIVAHQMELHQTIPIIHDVFHFTYTHNYGAAFGTLQNMQILLIAVNITVSAILLYLLTRYKNNHHWTMLLSFALIISGGLGNVFDRIRLGYVVDFMDFRIWPIFNVADMFVVSGCGLLLIYMAIVEPRLKGKEAS